VTIPETGEEVYLEDLMCGIDSLHLASARPSSLICLLGFTETASLPTRIMLPGIHVVTPIRTVCDSALARMVDAYDAQTAWYWKYVQYEVKTKKV